MNSRWRFDEMYKDHRDERKLKSPDEFKVQDRSHLAARISLAAYDLGFVTALRGMGRIVATDHLDVGGRGEYRPIRVRGVRALGTQAAHRASGRIWVATSQERDSNRFMQVRAFVPPDFASSNGFIRARLHLFAASKTGAAMLLGVDIAATVLPSWENRLNSYMERHGEWYARTELLRSASQFRPNDSAIISAFTLERIYSKFIPDLVKCATDMVAFYAEKAKTTGQNDAKGLVGLAEGYRDFIITIARRHEIPPFETSCAILPSATFLTVEKAVRRFGEAEGAPSDGERIDGQT